jgi:hypothetical protein
VNIIQRADDQLFAAWCKLRDAKVSLELAGEHQAAGEVEQAVSALEKARVTVKEALR